MPTLLESWKTAARQLKIQVYALYLAYQDARTPWYARLVAVCVVAYAFSPIDLIPDFIPILGYLDDLVLLPLGIKLALMLIPPEIMESSRARAAEQLKDAKPVGYTAAAIIVLSWLLLGIYFYRQMRP